MADSNKTFDKNDSLERYLGDGVPQQIPEKGKRDTAEEKRDINEGRGGKFNTTQTAGASKANTTVEFFKELIDYEKREKDALRIVCEELKNKVEFMGNCERELEKLSEEHVQFLQKFAKFEETHSTMKTVNLLIIL